MRLLVLSEGWRLPSNKEAKIDKTNKYLLGTNHYAEPEARGHQDLCPQ